MIKKGFDLFTTSPSLIEHKVWEFIEPSCCDVCTSRPLYIDFCKPFCKYRKATVIEWLVAKIGKEWRK